MHLNILPLQRLAAVAHNYSGETTNVKRYCPLIMPAGRPSQANAGTLYAFAHQLYWDFRSLHEGQQRAWFDRPTFDQLAATIGEIEIRLTDGQRRSAVEVVEEEIRAGRAKASDKASRLRDAQRGLESMTRELLRQGAIDVATSMKTVPGEPAVLAALLAAATPQRVRQLCTDAENWPIPYGSPLPAALADHAAAFIAATRDPRFPRSARPSSQLRQLWFLSRALAGASFGVKTRTAINLVGSMRPEETFAHSRAAKRTRRTVARKRLQKRTRRR